MVALHSYVSRMKATCGGRRCALHPWRCRLSPRPLHTTTTTTRPPAPFLQLHLHNYIIATMSLASKSQSQKLFEKLKSHRANKVSQSVVGPVAEH